MAYMSARGLKQSVRRKMQAMPRSIKGRRAELATLTRMPGPLGNGKERVDQRIVWREVSRAWHLREWRSHQRVEISLPYNQ